MACPVLLSFGTSHINVLTNEAKPNGVSRPFAGPRSAAFLSIKAPNCTRYGICLPEHKKLMSEIFVLAPRSARLHRHPFFSLARADLQRVRSGGHYRQVRMHAPLTTFRAWYSPVSEGEQHGRSRRTFEVWRRECRRNAVSGQPCFCDVCSTLALIVTPQSVLCGASCCV